ncbi:MAG: hypothetical protein ACI8T1_001175 [Verrucomicrobiales bacterium]|jgi:hypothetical protein
MAVKSNETLVVSKLELIAQLDSARWQLSRGGREFGDDLANKLSVKGQIQRSIKGSPSAWGVGLIVLGLLGARLIFRKKVRANDKKASYEKQGSPLLKSLTGTALKTVFLAFEPFIASLLKEQLSSSREPTTPHV